MSFANIVALGTLTRDPLAKNLGTEKAIVTGSIAINRKVKGEDKATFIDFKAFGRTADNIAKYFGKGSPIVIIGELEQERWQDKTTGEARQKLTVIVNRFDFAGGRRDDDRAPARDDDRPFASPHHKAQNDSEGRTRRQAPAARQPARDDNEDVPF